jgi:hypothetical protein
MRRLLMFVALLPALLIVGGCKISGPLEHNRNPQRVDDPLLSIPEQEKRGRDRMSLPEFEKSIAPPTGTDFPGPHGR